MPDQIMQIGRSSLLLTKYDPALANPGNGAVGYPIDNSTMYTSDNSKATKKFASGTPVTLYTAHYLAWYQWAKTPDGQISGGTGTRLDVAKSALISALDGLAVPIDAGLAVFNLNYPKEGDSDGGRVVYDLSLDQIS